MNQNKISMKVVHFTTGHEYTDPRIFLRECRSLAAKGIDIHLVVPGAPDANISGVSVHKTPRVSGGFISRLIKGSISILREIRKIDADIYHFHDLELIPIGLYAKFRGGIVIYDVHEDFPKVVLEREYIPKLLRGMISYIVLKIENYSALWFDGIVTVNYSIKARFGNWGCNSVIVTNYPDLSTLNIDPTDWSSKQKLVCYCGSLNKTLGLFEMIKSIGYADAKLSLAGWFSPETLHGQVKSMPGWPKIEFLGHISRSEVAKVYTKAMAGLILYEPGGNNADAMPNKLFEYMAAGIPVIASNFTHWKKMIEENKCGICVNPTDTQKVARTIEWIIAHPDEAKQMGQNGRRAVVEKYNWATESQKLISLYQSLGA